MPRDASRNVPGDAPQDASRNVPRDAPRDLQGGRAAERSEGTCQGTRHGTCQGDEPRDASRNVPVRGRARRRATRAPRASWSLQGQRSLVNYAVSALRGPRSLVNYAASEPPGLPGASRGLLGHAGAPRSLKLCKTSVSLETSSNILRGGCAIRERARAKSTFHRLLCPGRGSGPCDLSRILRNTRCGGCAICERARTKSTCSNFFVSRSELRTS